MLKVGVAIVTPATKAQQFLPDARDDDAVFITAPSYENRFHKWKNIDTITNSKSSGREHGWYYCKRFQNLLLIPHILCRTIARKSWISFAEKVSSESMNIIFFTAWKDRKFQEFLDSNRF